MQEIQNQPLVSIIVPIYNAKDVIGRCVASIRRQTYKNLEIFLINDGSTDISLQLCKMFADADPRIILIDKDNSGVSDTRNMGIRQATGKYLQFVDADDCLQPYATELLVEKAEQFETDIVIAHYNRIDPPPKRPDLPEAIQGTVVEETLNQLLSENPRIQSFGFLLEGYMDKKTFARGLMQEPASFYYGVMWNKLYRAELVKAHDDIICNEELNYSEDFMFNLSFIRYAERFYALSTPVYNYIQNPNSAVHKIAPLKVMSTKMELMNYYTDLYKDMGLYMDNRVRMFKYLFGIAES